MLDRLFGSRLRGKAIGWLFTHPDERFFVRQLTTILGEDSTNLSRELARLAGLGILTAVVEGRQKYYQVNSRCAIAAELHGLAVKTTGVADILREALGGLKNRIRAAFIYGSFARGGEQATSDVDIMVIGDVTFAEVSRALSPAQERLGREVNPSVYPLREFRGKVKPRHHFVRAVVRDKKVFLVGDEDDLERLGKKRLARRAQDDAAGD